MCEVREFTHTGRLLGYFCRVQPQGYIVVPARMELPPVQAYSDNGTLDPESDEQMSGMFKQDLARLLDEVEGFGGPALSIQSQREPGSDSHQLTWQALWHDPQTFAADLKTGAIIMNYQAGDAPLLTSNWDQGDPYNRKCPWGSATHCPVGCTPLAGAQIMRYWAWPPGYDWTNMPNELTGTSSQVHIDAVAKLCADVGQKAGAVYCVAGKDETFCFLASAPLKDDLLDALEDHFLYGSDADEEVRITESPTEWFNYFKEELSKNRPVAYELGTGMHTVVCDGWKQTASTRYLHLNYGWGGASTSWYALDTQPKRGPGEHTIIHLYPWCAQGAILTDGLLGAPGVCSVYFDQDAGTIAGAAPVQYLGGDCQFLPGVRVGTTFPGTNQAGASIKFAGPASGWATFRLYSIKGTSTASIKITGLASLKLSDKGSLRFF